MLMLDNFLSTASQLDTEELNAGVTRIIRPRGSSRVRSNYDKISDMATYNILPNANILEDNVIYWHSSPLFSVGRLAVSRV